MTSTTSTGDARAQAGARIDALTRQAVKERLWLTALFFVVFRRHAIAAEMTSRVPAPAPRPKSPFVYDMR